MAFPFPSRSGTCIYGRRRSLRWCCRIRAGQRRKSLHPQKVACLRSHFHRLGQAVTHYPDDLVPAQQEGNKRPLGPRNFRVHKEVLELLDSRSYPGVGNGLRTERCEAAGETVAAGGPSGQCRGWQWLLSPAGVAGQVVQVKVQSRSVQEPAS